MNWALESKHGVDAAKPLLHWLAELDLEDTEVRDLPTYNKHKMLWLGIKDISISSHHYDNDGTRSFHNCLTEEHTGTDSCHGTTAILIHALFLLWGLFKVRTNPK